MNQMKKNPISHGRNSSTTCSGEMARGPPETFTPALRSAGISVSSWYGIVVLKRETRESPDLNAPWISYSSTIFTLSIRPCSR
ncbi:MAG: hypothetical protein A2177_02895 [Spirochaetes bacterium RBG_13_68_11]|nr:MAG: hypothetical protein A2177_02895 [Spirochaetes bacterium RBG_13_68_11]